MSDRGPSVCSCQTTRVVRGPVVPRLAIINMIDLAVETPRSSGEIPLTSTSWPAQQTGLPRGNTTQGLPALMAFAHAGLPSLKRSPPWASNHHPRFPTQCTPSEDHHTCKSSHPYSDLSITFGFTSAPTSVLHRFDEDARSR